MIKKSCKICVPLIIGILLGYGLTKIFDKENTEVIENREEPSCDCNA